MEKIYLRTEVTKEGTIKFHYSLNNRNYIRFGEEVVSNFWGFLGIRHALYCYNLNGNMGGCADFDYFELESSHRGNNYDAFAGVDFSRYDDREGLNLVRPVVKRPMQYFTGINSGDWLVFNNLHFNKKPESIAIELKAPTSGAIIEIRKNLPEGELLASCTIQANTNKEKWEEQVFDIKGLKKGKEKLYFVFCGDSEGLSIKSFVFK